MKKFKKPISILLTVLMVFSVFAVVPFTASAAETDSIVLTSEDGVLMIDGSAASTTGFDYEGEYFDCYYLPAGNYMLNSDITVGRTVMINSGEVNLNIGEFNWTNNNSKGYGAGAFLVDGGTFTFDGTTGVICGQNNNLNRGGGVMAYNGTAIMKGGKISGCSAAIGPAVYCCYGGTFEMQGGEISGNSGWGAVVLQSYFRMSGGKITGNTDCAIQVWGGSNLYLSGNPVISGNKNANGDECNISLGDGIITVEGAFTDGASVGVTKPNGGVFTTGFDANNTVEPDEVFTADDSAGSLVTKSSDGEPQLEFVVWTASFEAGEGSGSIDAREVRRGSSFNLPAGGFTAPDGKMLSGWLSSADNQIYKPGEEVTMTTDTTFTAQWKPGFQYQFDFEDGLPSGWQAEDGWYVNTNGGDYEQFPAHSGTNNMTRFGSGSYDYRDLLTSSFDLSNAESASLSFWYTNRSWDGDTDQLVVSYRVGEGEWTQLFATSGDHGSWTNQIINLPDEVLAENVQFCFRAIDDYGFGIALDDVDLAAVIAPKKLFVGHSTTLGGDIGLNFFINSAAADFANAETATVKFTWDNEYSKEVDLKVLTADSNGYYKATVDVVAAQMAHKIHAEVYLNGEKLEETNDYSVRDYAEELYNNPEKYDSAKSEQLKTLAQALLNYGAQAQTVFDSALNEKPEPANTKVGENGFKDVTEEDMQNAINAANPGQTATDLSTVGADIGAKFYTHSLIYLSKNTLRIYFTKANDSFDASAFDGNIADYYYYLDKANIAAAQLDDLQTFTVGGTTFSFSALDYAKAVAFNSNMPKTQKNLAKSLYLYNAAANAYFD